MSGLSTEKYLTSPRLQRRLLHICRSYGRQDKYQDLYQSYCVSILEGKSSKQTLQQYFIDHARKEKWSKEKLVTNLKEIDEYGFEEDSIRLMDLHQISGTERALLILKFYWGFNHNELGFVFNVDPSRISQVVKAIKCDGRN